MPDEGVHLAHDCHVTGQEASSLPGQTHIWGMTAIRGHAPDHSTREFASSTSLIDRHPYAMAARMRFTRLLSRSDEPGSRSMLAAK